MRVSGVTDVVRPSWGRVCIQGLGLRAEGVASEFRVQGSGFRMQGSGYSVQGVGCKTYPVISFRSREFKV